MRQLLCALLLPVVASAQLQETITVARVVLDVRVTKYDGTPVRDLTRDDFTVAIDGKPAEIEAVEWIEDGESGRLFRQQQPEHANRPAGRMLVVFIQTDFAREESRLRGQMNFLQYTESLLSELTPDDRVAVFSFDSHLKFRLDFSNDHQAIADAMRQALRIDHPAPPPAVPNPSLAAHLDRTAMKRAASSEKALAIVGDALRHIEGPKSMLLMGWGLGVLSAGIVRMKPEYHEARRALDRSRTSIFALDTSHADYHSLEAGLQIAAKETGGFYAKTHLFPRMAVDRLHRVLEGHYELAVRLPERAKTRAISVKVKRRGLEVMSPTMY
ncbi:MAG TPA: VWA domain-containing protein [Thermoanaerobaculia bacterium]|jgi:VWFA-related protein